jgi:2,4-dichlorophenol 6-monooxygenase
LDRIHVPVLVVGGGPSGMLASILLSQQGIENRLVERRPGTRPAPQAHVVNARSLEICRAAGLDVAALRERGTRASDAGQVLWMTTLAGQELGRVGFGRRLPVELAATPTPLLNISQHLFEPLLLELLRLEKGSDLHHQHQWEASEPDEAGVTSLVRDLASDSSYEVRSRYVLAADGAGSRIRASLGIPMQGPEQIQSFVMIHCTGSLRDLVRDRPGILYWIMDPDCGGVLVAHDLDANWVFMHPHDPSLESPEAYTEERCAEVVRRALGSPSVDFRVETISFWAMTAQVAERYRAGRIFLVGDAAHRFPPTGGLGMNTGMQDVHNLVWKLRAVEQGWASLGLLDTYDVERRQVAQDNTDQSLRNALKTLDVARALGLSDDAAESRRNFDAVLADPAARERVETAVANQAEHFDMLGLELGFAYEAGALSPDGSEKPAGSVSEYRPSARPGCRLPHAWVERAGRKVSTLDLVPYDRLVLLTGTDSESWCRAADAVSDVPLECLVAGRDFIDPDGAWAAGCGIEAGGALLVRPDQHVAWRSPDAPSDASAALSAALAAVCKPKPSARSGEEG